MKKFIPFIIFCTLFGLLVSCDTCEDCNPLNKDPYINIAFINQDSLNKTNFAIAQADTLLLNLEQEIADIEQQITDAESEEEVSQLTIQRNQIQEQRTAVTSNRTRNQQVITQINAGRYRLSEYGILNGTRRSPAFSPGQDSVNSLERPYTLPLNMQEANSPFVLGATTRTDTLILSYQLETAQVDNAYFIDAFNVQVLQHSFDSVVFSPPCPTDAKCFSDETTLLLYF